MAGGDPNGPKRVLFQGEEMNALEAAIAAVQVAIDDPAVKDRANADLHRALAYLLDAERLDSRKD